MEVELVLCRLPESRGYDESDGFQSRQNLQSGIALKIEPNDRRDVFESYL